MTLVRPAWTLCVLALGTMGCATTLHGTSQTVRFESVPPGATVHVGDQTVTTPGELKLARKNTYDVTIEKPGYLPAHDHIGQTTSEGATGNILLGGAVGMLIDQSNGAEFNLEPATVSVTLVADPSAPTAPETTGASQSAPAGVPESDSTERRPRQ